MGRPFEDQYVRATFQPADFQRLRMAAAKKRIPMTEYARRAILGSLARDERRWAQE